MAQTIKLKRSATSGAVPTTSQLELGEVAINTNDGKMYFEKDDGTASIREVVTADQSSGDVDLSGHLSFGDSKEVRLGAGDDLKIYHNGSHSYISEQGAGDLYIGASNNLALMNSNFSKTYLLATDNDDLHLYHNNSVKLTTTSSGVDVTGTVTADGLTVDGDITVNDASPSISFFDTDGTNQLGQVRQVSDRIIVSARNNTAYGSIYFTSQDASTERNRMIIDGPTGDISFYEDTGTTAKMFWDSSAERLGLGTTSPSRALEIQSADSVNLRLKHTDGTASLIETGGTTGSVTFGSTGGAFIVRTGGGTGFADESEALKISSSGNVGIGTSSPGAKLDVNGEVFVSPNTAGKDTFQLTTNASNDARLKMLSDTTEKVDIQANGTSYFNGGNVGIGTSSPAAKLEVAGDIVLSDTTADSAAGPELTFERNSASPADADYLGQLKFQGKNDAAQDVLYAKITGKIDDVTDGTEDGIIETALKKAGSNVIVSRQTGDALKLLNGTGLEVDSTITSQSQSVGTQSIVSTAPTSASGFPNGHVWYVV